MLMNQILDSSNPLRDPDGRSRPLKRSASVASLPTPPRTQHRRSRSRPRSSMSRHDSDTGSASELDDDVGGRYAERIKRLKTTTTTRHSNDVSDNDELSEDESPDRKRRRTLVALPGHDDEEDDENAFWTGRVGPSCGDKQKKKAARADESGETSPSPAMLRYRVKAPVSPPPSRRQPVIHPARAASVEREETLTHSVGPVTPPRRLFLRAPSPSAVVAFKTPTKPKATKIWPKRDSPNNPFLVESSDKDRLPSEWDSADDEEVVGEARAREGTPTPSFEEKPTITYVFRGQKATFHNPLHGLAPEVVAASKLPIEHPDFEAAEACPPKRLFSAGKRRSRDRSRENNNNSSEGVKRAKVEHSDESDERSEDEQSGAGAEPQKEPFHADSAEAVAIPSKLACERRSRPVDDEELRGAREERQRREAAAKSRLASKDGLRAGAVFAERDEPARRAIGPPRSA